MGIKTSLAHKKSSSMHHHALVQVGDVHPSIGVSTHGIESFLKRPREHPKVPDTM